MYLTRVQCLMLLSFAELITSFEKCYTLSPKAVEVDHVFDINNSTQHFQPSWFQIHQSSIRKSCHAVQKLGSDKSENWKPDSPDPRQWLTILKVSGYYSKIQYMYCILYLIH